MGKEINNTSSCFLVPCNFELTLGMETYALILRMLTLTHY